MDFVAGQVAPYKKVRQVQFIDDHPEVGVGQDPAQGSANGLALDQFVGGPARAGLPVTEPDPGQRRQDQPGDAEDQPTGPARFGGGGGPHRRDGPLPRRCHRRAGWPGAAAAALAEAAAMAARAPRPAGATVASTTPQVRRRAAASRRLASRRQESMPGVASVAHRHGRRRERHSIWEGDRGAARAGPAGIGSGRGRQPPERCRRRRCPPSQGWATPGEPPARVESRSHRTHWCLVVGGAGVATVAPTASWAVPASGPVASSRR